MASFTNVTALNDTLPPTTMSLLQEEEEEEEFDTEFISRIMFLYIAPVLIFGGTAGNLLSFVILQGKFFRKSPSSFILSALSLVDTGVLLTGLLRHWIRALTLGEVDIRSLSRPQCKIHYLFTYMLPQLSSWTLMIMTLERLMSVTVPLKAREICSRKNMVAAWIAVAIGLFAVNSHAFKTLELFNYQYMSGNDTITVYYCTYSLETQWFTSYVWPWLDLVLITILPFVVIATANGVIVRRVIGAMRMRQDQMQAQGDNASVQSLTRMLVAISVVFLLSTTPVEIYFAAMELWPATTARDNYNLWIAYAITNLLYYTNNSINFLLYCVSGSRFRHALVSMFCCRDEKKSVSSASKYSMSTRVSTTRGPDKEEEEEEESNAKLGNSHI